ncbi:MAG: hypothetical protein JWO92_1830 [Chitinophagaceae bacterium]|nr:hypothetical protein [Chitinophagaceae bacterium]MDB5221936.1 hypothetical protein [Chitinophagaceae bacterium]
MDRVHTLIEKLQQQIAENATADKLLVTVQMLQSELLQQKGDNTSVSKGKVAVMMPGASNNNYQNQPYTKQTEQPVEQEEKIIEVLKVDEKEIEEELEEIKRNAEAKNQMSVNAKPSLLFDPVEDVPTLTHQTPVVNAQKNINESTARPESLNERLKQSKIELSDMLTEVPVRDLKKAIGVNDRFLFINELFRGDEAMYERSIKTINNFSIYPEAQYWIERELKVKIGWKESNPIVQQFDQLVKRRFS